MRIATLVLEGFGMQWGIVLFFVAACLAGIFIYIKTNKNAAQNAAKVFPKTGGNSAPPARLAAGEYLSKTPEGLSLVLSAPLLPPELENIDRAAGEFFLDAAAIGFTEGLHHADGYLCRVKEDCEARPDGTLAWKIRADDYDGSEFDQNPAAGIGEVFCAERCEVFKNSKGENELTGEFTICRGSLALMFNTVQNGLEHIVAGKNGRPDLAFANHSNGAFPHRMIPERPKI